MDDVRLNVWVQGRVQGVGFRHWVRSRGRALGLRGSAVNLADGRVAIIAEGPLRLCQELLDSLGDDQLPGYVGDIWHTWGEPKPEPSGFRVG